MVIRHIENFLEAFEKKFRLQKIGFLKHSSVPHQPDSESEFFKIQTFVTFPTVEGKKNALKVFCSHFMSFYPMELIFIG